jgi:hypothetical protein
LSSSRADVVREDASSLRNLIQPHLISSDYANQASNNHNSSNVQFKPEQIEKFQEFARSPNVYDRLVKSLAPSIWEMDDVKKGVLCLLFGGTMDDVKVSSVVDPDYQDYAPDVIVLDSAASGEATTTTYTPYSSTIR